MSDDDYPSARAAALIALHAGDAEGAWRALRPLLSHPRLVAAAELDDALAASPAELVDALTAARDAIQAFHEAQLRPDHTYHRNGITVVGRSVPVDRAGVYVPGGRGAWPACSRPARTPGSSCGG